MVNKPAKSNSKLQVNNNEGIESMIASDSLLITNS